MRRASHPDRIRAEIEIDAPIDRVWKILRDFDRYSEWNAFTPRVETTLEIGEPIHLYVRLVGDRLVHRVETVTRNQPYTIGWGVTMGWAAGSAGRPFLLDAERVQVLTPVDENRTHYMTEDVFRGWLRPLVLGLFGKSMQRGFDDCAWGLKKASESR